MTRLLLTLCGALLIVLLGAAADAACFADYKAKRDDPLRLHYGVIRVGNGTCGSLKNVERAVARRIASGGWELLTVMSTFGEAGAQRRKARAGEFYLRF